MRKLISIIISTTLTMFLVGGSAWAAKPSVGFIYVGPVGDGGWTHAHDLGRKALEEAGHKTYFVESVPEGSSEGQILKMARKSDIVFTTSFGFMDPTLKVSKKFPDKTFLHCSGFKQSKNMGNYFGRMYQAKYLAAMIAGGMSKKGRIGIVGSQPIPEIIRHINAITLGAQVLNPNVTVEVIWINSWFDPAKESDAAQALIDNGADVIVTMADSPATVQTSKKNGVYAIGNDTDMAIYGKEAHLTAAVWNWDVYYLEAVKSVENGTWKAGSHWWGLDSGIVGLTSFHPDVPQSLIIRMNKEKGKILSGAMDVFGHGFTKQDGTRVTKALNDGEMLGMMYYVKGIISKVPSG